jgi:hypothetical protein
MKDRFTDTQYQRLLRLPRAVFTFSVADSADITPLLNSIDNDRTSSDPLHRGLSIDLSGATFAAAWNGWKEIESAGADAIRREFRYIKKLLRDKLSAEEYNRFFASLFMSGVNLIRTTGSEVPKGLATFLALFEPDLDSGEAAQKGTSGG